MTDRLNALLGQHPEFAQMADETEAMRDQADTLIESDPKEALKIMIRVDTNMLQLLTYHVQLATECLRNI